MFNFESISVQEETFREVKTTIWIEKHVPISVSISPNFVENQIFSTTMILTTLLHFFGLLKGLALQRKAQMNFLLSDIETKIKKNWAAFRKNSLNVKIYGSVREGLTSVKIIVITKFVPQLNSCRHKKSNILIFRNLWTVLAKFFLCLLSKMQIMISI